MGRTHVQWKITFFQKERSRPPLTMTPRELEEIFFSSILSRELFLPRNGRIIFETPSFERLVEQANHTIELCLRDHPENFLPHEFLLIRDTENEFLIPAMEFIDIDSRIERITYALSHWTDSIEKLTDILNFRRGTEQNSRLILGMSISLCTILHSALPNYLMGPLSRHLFTQLVQFLSSYMRALESNQSQITQCRQGRRGSRIGNLISDVGKEIRMLLLSDLCKSTIYHGRQFILESTASQKRKILLDARMIFTTVAVASTFNSEYFRDSVRIRNLNL